MKRIYDKYGEYSLKNGIMKGPDKFAGYYNTGNCHQTFEKFFGSQSPFIADPRRTEKDGLTELERIAKETRADDIVVTLQCELYEFYNGAIKEVNYTRKKMLSTTKDAELVEESFKLEIMAGYGEDTTLIFKEMGNESFSSKPSDLIVKFAQVPKLGYCRKGNDLIVTKTISLIDAIQLKPVAVDTLDNRKVFVTPENVVSPQTELRVAGEGMPCGPTGDIVRDITTQLKKRGDQEKGDLFIKFNIEFPKRILHEHR